MLIQEGADERKIRWMKKVSLLVAQRTQAMVILVFAVADEQEGDLDILTPGTSGIESLLKN